MGVYRKYHYIPYELENESVSKTLEYAYDDWCIAQMAKALQKEDDYLFFLNASRNYTNLFDPGTGFMRGKSSAGEWKTPFSPLYSNHRDDEYTEGNAWQYSWLVQHDVEGLIPARRCRSFYNQTRQSLYPGCPAGRRKCLSRHQWFYRTICPWERTFPSHRLFIQLCRTATQNPAVCQQNSDRIISQYSGWPLRE